jgi:hypothetical protein
MFSLTFTRSISSHAPAAAVGLTLIPNEFLKIRTLVAVAFTVWRKLKSGPVVGEGRVHNGHPVGVGGAMLMPLAVRFNRLCLSSPAVVVGTIRDASVNLTTKIRGNEVVDFIPAPNPASKRAAARRPLNKTRADFEVDWKRLSTRRTPVDYQAWRDQRETAGKYAMWEHGERMPSQMPNSLIR